LVSELPERRLPEHAFGNYYLLGRSRRKPITKGEKNLKEKWVLNSPDVRKNIKLGQRSMGTSGQREEENKTEERKERLSIVSTVRRENPRQIRSREVKKRAVQTTIRPEKSVSLALGGGRSVYPLRKCSRGMKSAAA